MYEDAELHHAGEALRELLENPELREAIASAFYTGIEPASQFEEISLADHLRRARGRDAIDTPSGDVADKLNAAMESFVLDRLPQPAPITVEDLTTLCVDHLAGIDLRLADEDETVALAYQRFVTCAVIEIERERLDPRSVYYSLGEGWGPPEPDSGLAAWLVEEYCNVDPNDLPSINEDFDLWTSDSGFAFKCCIGGRGHYGDYDIVAGKFRGYCTERALRRLETQFSGLIESIAKTVQLCEPHARVSFLTEGDGQLIFRSCISAFSQSPDDEGVTILDRLRNAVVLLSQADSIAFEPIGLSLTMSAIEALVCEKDEVAVTKQVKRHVAALLVRDATKRKGEEPRKGKKEIKGKESIINDLYEIRSSVMHGSHIDWPHAREINDIARTIAAGVIRAVSCWLDNQLRAGGEISWKEFMDELNAASRKPAEMVGIPDLSNLIPDKLPYKPAKLIQKPRE